MSNKVAAALVAALLVGLAIWVNVRGEAPGSVVDPVSPWALDVQGGAAATLEQLSNSETGDTMRVTISSLADSTQTWHVKLVERPFVISAGVSYRVSFLARAAEPRPIGCAIGNNHDPWESLGTYHQHSVTTEWSTFECPITASADDSNARLFFDLGLSDAWVELTQVVVTDVTNGQVLEPI